jgi:hypothetical protein
VALPKSRKAAAFHRASLGIVKSGKEIPVFLDYGASVQDPETPPNIKQIGLDRTQLRI